MLLNLKFNKNQPTFKNNKLLIISWSYIIKSDHSLMSLPFLLHIDSHLSLLTKLLEFPSHPVYTKATHCPCFLLKYHRTLKLVQLPAATGSSHRLASGTGAAKTKQLLLYFMCTKIQYFLKSSTWWLISEHVITLINTCLYSAQTLSKQTQAYSV